jgi:hypothetical protein
MALSGLPPWLDVHPSDFVRAASEGAQAGLAVARLNQAADEAATRAAEHGKEFEEAQALRKWEQQQQMQMHAERMREDFQKSKDDLAARTMYQRSMMEARTQAETDRQATAKATQQHWQDSLDLQRQRMEGDAGKQSRLQSQEIRLEAKSELAGINQRIATVKNQLDKLQIKGGAMDPAERDAYSAAGQELMGLIDQQTKVQQKYASPPIVQLSNGSIPPPGPPTSRPGVPSLGAQGPSIPSSFPGPGMPTPGTATQGRTYMGPLSGEASAMQPPTTSAAGPALPMPSPNASLAPTKFTARDRAIRANALAIANPEWTDDQVKDAVRKEMP